VLFRTVLKKLYRGSSHPATTRDWLAIIFEAPPRLLSRRSPKLDSAHFSTRPPPSYTHDVPRNITSKRTPRVSQAAYALALAAALLTFYSTHASAGAAAAPPPTPNLESFYIVTQATFRDGPAWVDHVLELRPQGDGTLVREIRVAPLSADCPHCVTVRAIERLMPGASVQQLAGKFELCAHAEDDVDGMIHASKKDEEPNSIDDSATQTIIANCGGDRRMFELPYPETLRFEALNLANAHVAKFWEIAADLEAEVFGADFSLAKLTPEQDQQAQDLGAKAVVDLKAGAYKQGFADSTCPYAECRDHSAASALQGYSGPIFACPEN